MRTTYQLKITFPTNVVGVSDVYKDDSLSISLKLIQTEVQ